MENEAYVGYGLSRLIHNTNTFYCIMVNDSRSIPIEVVVVVTAIAVVTVVPVVAVVVVAVEAVAVVNTSTPNGPNGRPYQ